MRSEAWATPIWRAERGRYGRAIHALAHRSHEISLPLWARQPWTVLHEMAHRLTHGDEAHGARFVGVLIGLLARHDDRDAKELMEAALEQGVQFHVRSIGSVPVREPATITDRVEQALVEQGPLSEMDLACWLDLHWRQVRGAALVLQRRGRARWFRSKLLLVEASAA
jgi:hypothetical protein